MFGRNFMKKVTIIDHVTEKEIFNKSLKRCLRSFNFVIFDTLIFSIYPNLPRTHLCLCVLGCFFVSIVWNKCIFSNQSFFCFEATYLHTSYLRIYTLFISTLRIIWELKSIVTIKKSIFHISIRNDRGLQKIKRLEKCRHVERINSLRTSFLIILVNYWLRIIFCKLTSKQSLCSNQFDATLQTRSRACTKMKDLHIWVT